jgi:hypothetical protein
MPNPIVRELLYAFEWWTRGVLGGLGIAVAANLIITAINIIGGMSWGLLTWIFKIRMALFGMVGFVVGGIVGIIIGYVRVSRD